MKVLIVDDNVDITEMLAKYLTVKGFDCVIANDGLNGLNQIKKEKFSTIFLDMSMPDFGGRDVIAALEKENLLKDQRIVIFTASATDNNVIQELLAKDGIELWLKKPVQLKDLLRAVTET